MPEEEPEPAEKLKFEAYLKIGGSEYLPPKGAGGAQQIRLTLDVSPDIPVKTKFYLELLYNGLPVETTTFQLKDERRKGVAVEWKFKKRLGVGQYMLFSSIPLDEQTPAVLTALQQKGQRFPMLYVPWAWTYFEEDEAIQIGTPEEAAEQRRLILTFYEGKIREFTDRRDEIRGLISDVKEGKKFKSGPLVDGEAFAAAFREWCKKQASTQKALKDFMMSNPALWGSTMESHLELERLGRMVSKEAWVSQEKLTDEVALERFELEIDPNEKSDEVLRYFNRFYRPRVDDDTIEAVVAKIYSLLGVKRKETKADEGVGAKAESPKKPADKSDTGKDGDEN